MSLERLVRKLFYDWVLELARPSRETPEAAPTPRQDEPERLGRQARPPAAAPQGPEPAARAGDAKPSYGYAKPADGDPPNSQGAAPPRLGRIAACAGLAGSLSIVLLVIFKVILKVIFKSDDQSTQNLMLGVGAFLGLLLAGFPLGFTLRAFSYKTWRALQVIGLLGLSLASLFCGSSAIVIISHYVPYALFIIALVSILFLIASTLLKTGLKHLQWPVLCVVFSILFLVFGYIAQSNDVLASALDWVGVPGAAILIIYHSFSIYSAFKPATHAKYSPQYMRQGDDTQISYGETVHAFLAFASLAFALFGAIFPYNGPKNTPQIRVHFFPVIQQFMNHGDDSIDVSLEKASFKSRDANGGMPTLATAEKNGWFKLTGKETLAHIIDQLDLCCAIFPYAENDDIDNVLKKFDTIMFQIQPKNKSAARTTSIDILPKLKQLTKSNSRIKSQKGVFWRITGDLKALIKDLNVRGNTFRFETMPKLKD